MLGIKYWHIVLAILTAYFIALLPMVLSPDMRVDESTHSFVGLFIRDSVMDWLRTPTISYQKIYNYATSYLAFYPKISIHYPPMTQIFFAVVYSIITPSIQASRVFILASSVAFLILIFYFTDHLFKDKRVAIVAMLIFASSPLIIAHSVQAVQEIPLLLFFTLTFFLFIKAFETGDKRYYILAIISTVFTVLSKWQAIAIFPAIFIYSAAFDRKRLMFVTISLAVAALILLPYYLLLFKAGILTQPLINAQSPGALPWYSPVSLTFYLKSLLFDQFLLPIGILLFVASLLYFYKRCKYWKLFVVWILVVYVIMTIIPNKNVNPPGKYTIIMLPAIILPGSYILVNFFRNFSKMGIMALLILILFVFFFVPKPIADATENLILTVNYPNFIPSAYAGVQDTSQYVLTQSRGNILVNTLLGSSSPFIFEIARNSHFSHQVINPCALENNESYLSIVDGYGVDVVISEKNALEMTERQRGFVDFLNTSGEFSIGKEFEQFTVYKRQDFTPISNRTICNYICSTEATVCSKYLVPSEALK